MNSFQHIDWGGMAVKVVSAIVIIAVTAILAVLVKKAAAKLAQRIPALNRPGVDGASLGASIGSILSLVIWLLGLVAVLGVFQLDQVLSPVTGMLNTALGFLPNVIGAAFVFIIGLMIARVVRQLIETALAAIDFSRFTAGAGRIADVPTGTSHQSAVSKKASKKQAKAAAPALGAEENAWGTGESGAHAAGTRPEDAHPRSNSNIPSIVATVVFAVIMIVVSIAALQILGIAAISQPAEQMLTTIFDALPNVFAALILLGIGVFIARFAGQLLRQVLEGAGLDERLRRSELVPAGTSVVSTIVTIVNIAIVVFFAVMAAEVLGFPQITKLLDQVLRLGGSIVFGAAIIAVGFFVANFLARIVHGLSGTIVKWVTIVLFVAMGLKSMGVADSIIELAFGALVIGGAATATLAFGLGGRDVAARQLAKLERKGEQAAQEQKVQGA